MTSKVRVSATFSFRGETHHPEMELDLDRFLAEGRSLDDLYPMLAAANGIGAYSYEYEVLEMAPLHFDRPEGLAVAHVHDGRLDLEGLRRDFEAARERRLLEEIARRTMGLEDPDRLPGLLDALRAAYRAGRDR